jgi:Asp-tRNA(Asn)/Glu-tRNA(Gln) amidotransferase A subunit family amidase
MVVAAPLTALVWPAASELKALSELINLGFFRGIMNQLDKIDKAQPECHAFVAVMQGLARQFEFETMARQIDAQATVQKPLSGAVT